MFCFLVFTFSCGRDVGQQTLLEGSTLLEQFSEDETKQQCDVVWPPKELDKLILDIIIMH